MSDDLIKSVQELIDSGKGDLGRLNYILNTLKQGKPLFSSDQKYLENILHSNSVKKEEIEVKDDSVEKLKEELSKANERIRELGQERKKENELEMLKRQIDVTTRAHMIGHKSMALTAVLSIILGFLVLPGIGHMYVRKFGRGLAILLGSWGLLGMGSVLGIGGSIGFSSFSRFDPSYYANAAGYMIVAMIALLVGYYAVIIWQIFDSYKLCKKYNNYVDGHGTRPW